MLLCLNWMDNVKHDLSVPMIYKFLLRIFLIYNRIFDEYTRKIKNFLSRPQICASFATVLPSNAMKRPHTTSSFYECIPKMASGVHFQGQCYFCEETWNKWSLGKYSVSTNFRLELIEPSTREVFFLLLQVERVRWGEENMAQTKRDSKQRQS